MRQTTAEDSRVPARLGSPNPYTFGDNPVAADRLALLAATYEPSSARLLRLGASLSPKHAVDLGCGPGYSTRLLHAIVAPTTTIGVDRSPEHVARARATAPPGIDYVVHDAIVAPLPGERPDLLYCRFLLTHLRDPARALATWAEAASDRAALIVEETVALASAHPSFRLYYSLVAELQRHYGQDLEIGRTLDGALIGTGWSAEISVVRELSLPAARMARLHAMNLATWSCDPFARAAFPPDAIAELGASLEAIATGATEGPEVRHSMRQMILMKR